jgi:threonine dehydratase
VDAAKSGGAEFIHPFDDEDVIAGQGTVALEMLEQNDSLDTILAPAGGGGLLAGAAFAIKSVNPKVRVIGVQAAGADAIVQSFHARRHISTDSVSTIADGIAVKNPGAITVDYINKYVDDMVTVTDEEIASTIILLMERTKLIVEPAGAVGLAACLHKKFAFGKKNACILSGGNIDVGLISKIIEKGLVSRGRRLTISLTLVDKPGTLENFAAIMSKNNANIYSVHYDRTSADLHLNETIIQVIFEVSGFKHGESVVAELKRNGYTLA